MSKASVVQRDVAKVTLAASCVFDGIQISQVLVGGHLRRVESTTTERVGKHEVAILYQSR